MRRLLIITLDVLCVLLLLKVGWTAWPREVATEVPTWGASTDLVLDGPDAGAWALNAQALADGRYHDLEAYRMPTYVLLVKSFMDRGLNVVLAGHLVSRLAHLLMPVALYALGRVSGGAGVGLLAGLGVMTCERLMHDSQLFGVDPTIRLLIPLALFASLLTARLWWLGPLTGLLLAFAATTHITTIPYIIPCLLGAMIFAPSWRHRGLALGGIGLTAGLVLARIFSVYPSFTPSTLWHTIQEALKHSSTEQRFNQGQAQIQLSFLESWEKSLGHMLEQLKVEGVPWYLLVIAFYLGIFGPGLRSSDKPGWRGLLQRVDVLNGLLLLSCLAPLPILASTGAPERYANNFLPFAMLLIARGLASVVGVAAIPLGRWKLDWVLLEGVMVAGALWWGSTAYEVRKKVFKVPVRSEVPFLFKDAGEAIAAKVPDLPYVVAPVREVAVHAGTAPCPQQTCPRYNTEESYTRCLQYIAQECRGDAPIPYVALQIPDFWLENRNRPAMDRWILQKWPAITSGSRGSFRYDITLIPRDQIPTASGPAAGGQGGGPPQ